MKVYSRSDEGVKTQVFKINTIFLVENKIGWITLGFC